MALRNARRDPRLGSLGRRPRSCRKSPLHGVERAPMFSYAPSLHLGRTPTGNSRMASEDRLHDHHYATPRACTKGKPPATVSDNTHVCEKRKEPSAVPTTDLRAATLR